MPDDGKGAAAAGNASADPAAAANAAAASAAAASAGAVTVPEKYSLALPDKALIGADALERVTATARSLKVADDAGAQSLVTFLDAEAKAVLATYEDARKPGGARHQALVQQVAADALAHPKLGNGDPTRLEMAQHKAGLVLAQFGSDGMAATVKARGYLVPEEMTLLVGIYDAMQEKPLATGAPPKAGTQAELYPGGIPLDTAMVAVP